MANHQNKDHRKEGKETVEFFKDLDKDALNIEGFLEKYAKPLSYVFVLLVVGVVGWFSYQQFVIAPKNEDATKGYLAAQKNLSDGKEDLALGGKSVANPGFIGTYDEYSSTKAGKLSAYNAGLIEFKNGNFQKSYDLLDKFSSNNNILMALKYGAMSDCLSNLNKSDDAFALAEKATTASDDPYTSYYFTKKAGMLALAQKKNAEAKKYFSIIDEKYKEYDNGQSTSFIEMTKYY